MTEPTQNDVTPAEVVAAPEAEGVAVEVPEAEVLPVPPAKTARRINRRVAALFGAGVAVAVLVGGGAAASSAIADADREAPTAYWVPVGEQMGKTVEPGNVPANELTGKLLPIPAGFTLGPDLGAYGKDFYVSGQKAVDGFKESRNGLSTTERKKRDELLAGLKLKGLAGRSYTKFERKGGWVAEVRIMQADPKAVGNHAEFVKKLLELTGDERPAPKVDGFPDAKCSLMAMGAEGKETIDSMDCTAVEGDVVVTFRAYGAKPFSTTDAVAFFKNQMSHLKTPGESA
ncbi:hypothetical protein [Streptomyces sp. NBC_01264]|uniref:hypothetical protein n=1 Tax=Streptomyces sp. NBC_01264 TaxID=2903804 RepID=UPI00225B600E|nr:hypothetical protein [Streptomyces sp. NBC_01264]MCX4779363.1 hypothetical protein [Streptomyces sp. NBC_01264]